MANMLVGYSRVSSDGQDTTNQIAALKQAGCKSIFSEKASGAITDRKQLRKAIAALQRDDLLVVTKLDRLARSLRDLLNTLARVQERGAGFKVLDTPALDTTNPYGKLLLNQLGAIAEFEREMIRSRCAEGIKSAKARGIAFGRPKALTPLQAREAKARKAAGESHRAIADSYNVSHSTIARLAE
jgi:DNA invertase Pin-like site-specific DNA recombinase